jgi:hypothetical protein
MRDCLVIKITLLFRVFSYVLNSWVDARNKECSFNWLEKGRRVCDTTRLKLTLLGPLVCIMHVHPLTWMQTLEYKFQLLILIHNVEDVNQSPETPEGPEQTPTLKGYTAQLCNTHPFDKHSKANTIVSKSPKSLARNSYSWKLFKKWLAISPCTPIPITFLHQK